MSRKQRQGMIDRERRKVSLARQCTLLDISRAWLYYQPKSRKGLQNQQTVLLSGIEILPQVAEDSLNLASLLFE